jgi:hypothetical protein
VRVISGGFFHFKRCNIKNHKPINISGTDVKYGIRVKKSYFSAYFFTIPFEKLNNREYLTAVAK